MKNKTQKVIIPKGAIDPNEDTLIEVPTGMKGKPFIVAHKQKRISVEESSKNVEFRPYSERADDRTISTVESGRRSLRPEMDTYFVGRNFNDTDDDDFDRSFNKRERSRRSLEDTDSRPCRNVDCAVGTDESLRKPKRSTVSTCALCDIAIQCEPPKSLPVSSSPKKSRTSIEFLPHPTSSPERIIDSSTDINQVQSKSSQVFIEGERKSFSLKKNQGITATCTNPVCLTSGQESKREDLFTAPTNVSKGERKELSAEEECRECCDQYDKPPKVSRTLKKHQQMRSPEELRKMYKCPDCNVDDVYIQQLKAQFAEAKRKLEEAIVLASMSLKQLKSSQRFSTMMPRNRADSLVDSVPERDISFIPSYRNKSPFVPCVRDSYEKLNENNRLAADSSSPRDRYKTTEMYNNITTRTTTQLGPTRSPIQQDLDNPCPFLKTSIPAESPCYRLYKEKLIQTGERSDTDITRDENDKPRKDSVGSIQICPGCATGCCTTAHSSRTAVRDNSKILGQDSDMRSSTDSRKEKEKSPGYFKRKKKRPSSDDGVPLSE